MQTITQGIRHRCDSGKITFHIEEREKAAIVGVNGGREDDAFQGSDREISADGGEFYLKKDASLGYLAQNIQIDSDRTIYEEMLSVFEKIIQTETNLRELENEMGKSERTGAGGKNGGICHSAALF